MNPENKYKTIIKELENYQKKDFSFSSGHILGSMCTQPHKISKEVYFKFLETNLGDPELFPGTKDIEIKFISFISNLLNAPKTSTGLITSGGTESNIIAIWLAKKITGKREIVIPKSAHFSFKKIESLMDVKLKSIPLDKNYCMDFSSIKKIINNKTAAIVGIAGSTELGTIDPINKLSDLCESENIFLHVDAAFGGFIIPFLKDLGYEHKDFDFSLKGVSSISIDSHKMGCAAIPLGTLVIKDKKWLEDISVKTHYVSGNKQTGILATRSGGPVAAAYAVTKYLGKNGYKNIVKQCMKNTKYIEGKINNLGLNLVMKPTMNVLGIKLKKPDKVAKQLSNLGWKVNKMDRLSSIRIVLMPHVTKDIIDNFIPDLEKVCKKTGEL